MALGQGPFGFWMSSLLMVVLLGLAALVLPFAVASSWGRFRLFGVQVGLMAYVHEVRHHCMNCGTFATG
jgi:hypothetical protein